MASETIKCVATAEFTRFVEGFGIVVGAPESTLPEAKNPLVPVKAIAGFVAEGLIKAPKGFDAEVAAEAPAGEQAPA